MKLTNDDYYNTGGGCMVMYVDVAEGGEILQFGCNDEMICALDDLEENTSVWYIDEYSELVKLVGDDIAKQLHERFLKYEDCAQWFPRGE